MGHCLKNEHWTLSACMALGFAYHVDFEGEQATVWLTRIRDVPLGFQIEQIKGPANRTPSEQLIAHVLGWLQFHEQWTLHRSGQSSRPPGDVPHPLPDVWTRPLPPIAEQYRGGVDDIPF